MRYLKKKNENSSGFSCQYSDVLPSPSVSTLQLLVLVLEILSCPFYTAFLVNNSTPNRLGLVSVLSLTFGTKWEVGFTLSASKLLPAEHNSNNNKANKLSAN